MRISVLLACMLVFSVCSGAQQTEGRPAKILTPEQQAYQRQVQALEAKRDQLRRQAKEAFAAEMAREKAGDCPEAQNTRDFNTCFGDAASIADQHLKAYEEALKAIVALRYDTSSPTPPLDMAGPAQTPEQDAAEFVNLEKLWRGYLDAASTAAFHQFDGGTGGPSFELETHLRLVRDHMRELDMLYGMMLRL
jgi:hypothetical protein